MFQTFSTKNEKEHATGVCNPDKQKKSRSRLSETTVASGTEKKKTALADAFHRQYKGTTFPTDVFRFV